MTIVGAMTKVDRTTAIPWAFRARFRRGAFGWKNSQLAISRISEALSEIRAVARHDPASAGEGAVLLLEKLSGALCQVDSSSGALGNATYCAVQELAQIISSAPVSVTLRQKWLNRLFEAFQEDDPPYIESLGDHWGELCITEELASEWSDQLLVTLRSVLKERGRGTFAFFPGTTLCYSALFKAGRHEELLEVLAMDPHPIWPYLIWGARVLAARGQVNEAIQYLRDRSGRNVNEEAVARFAEEQLLKAGRRAEAFDQYALLANKGNSNLATYRVLAKKYPELDSEQLLAHLVASTLGEQGKWFATAKTLKLFDQAVRLAWISPCDPKTLMRAARDNLSSRPAFAMQCALAALHWMSMGYGYELTGLDVVEAHRLSTQAAAAAQQTDQANTLMEQLFGIERPKSAWMSRMLAQEPSKRVSHQ